MALFIIKLELNINSFLLPLLLTLSIKKRLNAPFLMALI
jgi:hypothetical protein